MKTVSDLLAKAVRALALALAVLGASGAHSAITFDNTPSGGSASSTSIELIRDTVVDAPSGQYIGLTFSSNVAISNVYARAIVSGTGYTLDATETAIHSLGDLNATAKTSYWYINIPNTTVNGSFTVEVYAGGLPGAGGVLQGTSPAYTLSSADVDQSASSNKIASVVINGGNPVVLGQAFDAVVCYDVNSANGTNVLVNSASTAAFDPAGLRLLNVPSIQMFGGAGCTGTLIATHSNRLYYTGVGSNSLNALRVTYRFQAVSQSVMYLSPIVSARSGQYKYNSDFSTSIAAVVPAASNTVVLAKSVNIASSPGATRVTYTLTASNGGSSAVTLDSFVDTLPASPAAVSYVSGSSAFNGAAIGDPLISGNTLTWGDPGGANAFSIPAGGSRSLTFQADIPANSGTYTNSAIAKVGAVTIDTTLAEGDNASATATTRVGQPQLRVTKTTGTPQISGSTATYTVTVTNDGGSTAAGVVLTDSLPSGFTYAATSAITLGGGATRSVTVDPIAGAGTPAWSEFSIPSGGSVAITFSANVAAGTPDGSYNNSASVSTTTAPAAVENFDGATQSSDDVVVSSAALLVNKTTGSTTVVNTTAGATASYVVTVSNSSTATATATGVVLTDALPVGFSYAATGGVVLNGGAARPTVSDPAVGAVAPAWGGFTIPVGASVAITFIANVSPTVADGVYDNSASATTDTLRATVTHFDGVNRTDDNVTVTSAVLTTAKITSSPSVSMAASGATASYTITVNNSGTAAATAVRVTDLLAAGFSFGTTSSVVLNGVTLAASAYQVLTSGAQTPQTPQWDTSPAGGFTINAGQSLVIAFTANIAASVASGTYNNSVNTAGAARSVGGFDGNSSSITDDNVTVASAALTTSKSTSTPAVVNTSAGTTARYTITVHNTGGGAATGVKVHDSSLPQGFTYGATVGVTLNGTALAAGEYQVVTSGTYSPNDPLWDSSSSGGFTVEPGQSLVIEFDALIGASVTDGTYHNSVTTLGAAGSITQFDGAASAATSDDVTVSSAALAVSKGTSTPAVNMSGGAASAVYSLTVANTGSAAATGVRLVDLLPSGFSYGSTESVTIAGVSQAFTVLTSGAQSPSSPQWDTQPSGGFTIPAGQSLVVVFNAVIDASVASGVYHNSAQASSNARTINNFDGSASSADDVTVLSGVNVHGTVYADVNHNTRSDAGETGTGLTIYLKLVPVSSLAGPASQVATAHASTGAYTFGGVVAGQYTIVLDDNPALADVTPSFPAGWLGTEMSDGLRSNVVVTDTDLPNQNFGLFQGARLTGSVFDDSGLAGGTAHNGQPDGGESGIARATVRATDASGATLLATASTDGAGRYTLWIPLTGPASAVRIVQSNLLGWVSVGGSSGSTGGVYARASDAVDFSAAGGAVYTGVNFGDVRENTLAADGRQHTAPGSVVFYAHRFTPGSSGTVSFNLASAAQPSTVTGFTQLLLHDLNCNGRGDASEPVLTQNSPLTVQVGVPVCVIVKDTVPTNAPINASKIITLTANFAYAGAVPALSSTHANTDVTVVALASALTLSKSQSTASVVPGATITYTLEYTNNGSGPLSSIRLNDVTPAYTHFVAAECGQLAAGIGTCTVTRQPIPGAAGTIEWTLTGSLAPAASGTVRFTVRVDQ